MSNFEELDLTILKGLVSDREKALSFVNENPDGKLFSPDVWNFANLTLSYIRTYKDVPTLQAICLKLKGKESAIDSVKNIWNKLESTEYLSQEFAFNVDRMRERYQTREILSLKERLEDASGEDAVGEIQRSLQNIKATKGINTFENKSVKEYLPIFAEKFKAKRDNPNLQTGIKTGFSFIDYATNSLQLQDMVLVAGGTGSGKSVLLNSLSVNIWMGQNKIDDTEFKDGHSCIFFSLEMPYHACYIRFLSCLAEVPSRNIENASLTKAEYDRVKKALDFIKNYPYEFRIIDLTDPSSNDLDAVINGLNKHYDLITVDYLNIMRSNSGKEDSDHLTQGAISYELKNLGRKHDSIMLTGNQINRATGTEKIGLHRISRAAQISTNCTLIMLLEDRENESRHSDMSIHIIKNRRGPQGAFKLLKNMACSSLKDIEIDKEGGDSEDQFTDLDDISCKMEDMDF